MDNEDIRVVPGEESSAGDAATEFRHSLDTRRDAEDVLAAALEAGQHASAYADEIIRHSEALATRSRRKLESRPGSQRSRRRGAPSRS